MIYKCSNKINNFFVLSPKVRIWSGTHNCLFFTSTWKYLCCAQESGICPRMVSIAYKHGRSLHLRSDLTVQSLEGKHGRNPMKISLVRQVKSMGLIRLTSWQPKATTIWNSVLLQNEQNRVTLILEFPIWWYEPRWMLQVSRKLKQLFTAE
jgi:hypothetical protein